MEEPRKILVLDDEPDMLNMIRMRLESAGYNVTTANNGQQGLEKVEEQIPDLIISDVLMPVMDGFAFYKELKKNQTTATVPVLILTARGNMEDAFVTMGADEFIGKPFETDEFLKKVSKLLSSEKKAEQPTGHVKIPVTELEHKKMNQSPVNHQPVSTIKEERKRNESMAVVIAAVFVLVMVLVAIWMFISMQRG